MKNTIILVGIIVVILAGLIWLPKSNPSTTDPDIVSRNGLHWHPELTILVKGKKQVIPANIGIGAQYASNPTFDRGMSMTAVHTHDDANQGIIHFEFSGVVRKSDLTLGKFLEIWGKNVNSFGSNPKMTVNGVENTELQNYVMQDGDKIVLSYE